MTKEMNNNMIFDLQRFVDPETYYGTSNSESITVSKSGNDHQAVVTSENNETLEPVNDGAKMNGLNAGAGEDTIIVENTVENISIAGGKNDDFISIASGSKGNTYVFNYGDGKDTIDARYWDSEKDKLIFNHSYSPSMSEDGKELIIKAGTHSVTFINMQYGQTVKVVREDGTEGTVTFSKIMQGTARSDEIDNSTNPNSGNSSDDYWLIDGAAGNDVINNKGSNVLIDGGAGKDEINIFANNGAVTNGVSIRGGNGNDKIDVEADSIEGADRKKGEKVGAHVYIFDTADGVDSIFGYNSNDSIVLEGDLGTNYASLDSSVDLDGNFILTAGATTIKIIANSGEMLGGTKLNIFLKNGTTVQDIKDVTAGANRLKEIATAVYDGSNNITHFEIPKKILLTNGSDEKSYDSTYKNYSISAASGNDYITITGAAISVDAGIGNDQISLASGTNIDTNPSDTNNKYTTVSGYALLSNNALVTADAVTIQGGYGNDYIDVTSDTKVVRGTTVRAGHVYEIDANGSGRDSIVGFNEYDTIKVSNFNTTGTLADTRTRFYAGFDGSGQFLILGFGNSEVWLDVSQDYFKGAKTVNIVNESGTAITGLGKEENVESYLINAGYSPLSVVSLTAAGNETTDSTLATSWKYVVPSKLVGTKWDDDLNNVDDNFTVDAKQADDVITNVGAKDVSISGGAGADTIRLLKKIVGDKDVYATGVTVNAGTGDDVIFNEYVKVGNDSSDTAYATSINDVKGNYQGYAMIDKKVKKGHVYEFVTGDGNDSIYFFGDNDTIKIGNAQTELLNCKVDGTNLILNFGFTGGTKVYSTITLVDFAKPGSQNSDPLSKSVKILKYDGTTDVIDIPREILGTNGSDGIAALTNFDSDYKILALSGHDEVFNGGEGVSISGGAGHDSIVNTAEEVTVDGGYGNDYIFLNNNAVNTIKAGAGNDRIYNYESGGHVYVFGENQGINYIFGFQDGDTILFEGITDSYETSADGKKTYTKIIREFTNDGVVLTVKDGNGVNGLDLTKIYIKGELQVTDAITDKQSYIETKKSAMEEAKTDFDAEPGNITKASAYTVAKNAYVSAVKDFNSYLAEHATFANLKANESIIIQAVNTVANTNISSKDTYTVPKEIIGTNGSDYVDESGTAWGVGNIEIDKDMDNYTVDAKSGHDSILSNANNVSINAGIGDDTIKLGDEGNGNRAFQNTVKGGIGNDLIINNGNSHLFEYAVGDGNDTIQGFSVNDTITITGADSFSTVMNGDGFKISVVKDGYILGSILVKNPTETETININGTKYAVPKEKYGTKTKDNVTIKADEKEYTYYALNGDDIISVEGGAQSILVNAGDGYDTINVANGAKDITIEPSYRDDVINLETDSRYSRTIVITDQFQGVNYINGITSKDVIWLNYQYQYRNANDQIVSADGYISSGEFDEDGNFVITLNDAKTKLVLRGTYDDSEQQYKSLNADGQAKSFQLRTYNQDENSDTPYKIPSIQNITGTTQIPITDNEKLVLGDDNNNDILIKANNVTVESGAGNDKINVASGNEMVITPGEGDDQITLETDSGHIINYKRDDGNDTIHNWQSSNFLNITGFTKDQYRVSMTGDDGNTFALVFTNGDVITFDDLKAGEQERKVVLIGDVTNGDTNAADTVLPSGETVKSVKLTIAPSILGSASANNLSNTEFRGMDSFTIVGYEGNDTIENEGNYASLVGAADDDSIVSKGHYVTILGGSGNDTVKVSDSRYNTITGGAGDDVVSLGSDVDETTVMGGAGNDTIYGNTQNNTFVFEAGHGNDTIYGFHKDDVLKVINGTVKTKESGGETIADVDVTADGLVIKLTTGETLTLRGAKKADATGDTANDFELLGRTDGFTIQGATAADTVKVVIQNKVVAQPETELQNDKEYVLLQGVGNDTVKNTADNVTVDAGSNADVIYNTGSKVSISGGGGRDVIYLSKPYEWVANEETHKYEKSYDQNVEITSSATAVTVNAGASHDTIWGNNQGDNDSTLAHVYEYTKGDGKDVIYYFGLNDSIKVYNNADSPLITNVEYENTTKEVWTTNGVHKKDPATGDLLYSYDFDATGYTANAETTDTTKEYTNTEAKDGDGLQWRLKDVGGNISDSTTWTTDSTQGSTLIFKDSEGNLKTSEIFTPTDLQAKTPVTKDKQVYLAAGKDASVLNDGINDDEVTTDVASADDPAQPVYQYEYNGSIHYTVNQNPSVTFADYTGNGTEPLYLPQDATFDPEDTNNLKTEAEIRTAAGDSGADAAMAAATAVKIGLDGNPTTETSANATTTASTQTVPYNWYLKSDANASDGIAEDEITTDTAEADTSKQIYTYTNDKGETVYTTETTTANLTVTYTAYNNGTGRNLYLKEGGTIGVAEDMTTDSTITGVTQIFKDHDGNLTTERTSTVNGTPVMINGFVTVDDPDHKNVIIKIGTGSITLKNVEVGKGDRKDNTINLWVQESGTTGALVDKSFYVPKKHVLGTDEGTAANPFTNNETANDVEDRYEIKGNGLGNNVVNNGKYALIDLSVGGANTIDNSGAYAELKGSNLADSITNAANGVSITAGDGVNRITNTAAGKNSSITSGKDADTITNAGQNVTINAGAGNNVITNNGTQALITTAQTVITEDSADSITNNAANTTIYTGAGNDTIRLNNSSGVEVKAGTGNNVIYSNATGRRTYVYDYTYGFGNDTISEWNNNDSIQLALDTNDTYTYEYTRNGIVLTIYKHEVGTNGAEDTDTTLGTITIGRITGQDAEGNFITTPLEGGKSVAVWVNSAVEADYIKIPYAVYTDNHGEAEVTAAQTPSSKERYTIIGDENKNKLVNSGANTTINADAGNDTIFSTGANAVINGGDGEDLIVLAAEENYSSDKITAGGTPDVKVSIDAGKGNDTIVSNDYDYTNENGYDNHTRNNKVIYNYTLGDGNDIIRGYTKGDVIQITGVTASDITTTVNSDNHFIINVGSGENAGTIKLEGYQAVTGAAKKYVQIAIRPDAETEEFTSLEEIVVPRYETTHETDHTLRTVNDNVFISGRNVAETIESGGDNAIIQAAGGNDSIVLTKDASEVQIYAGAGNDIITAVQNHSAGVTYIFNEYENGNKIINFNNNDIIRYNGTWNPDLEGATLSASTPTDEQPQGKTIVLNFNGTQVSLDAFGTSASDSVNVVYLDDDGNELTGTFSAGNVIPGTEYADNLPGVGANTQDSVAIYGYGGADIIYNSADKVEIYGGEDNDSISHVSLTTENSASESSIYGGNGNDYITVKGAKNYVDGGAGNDFITLQAGSGESTINMSAGVDRIQLDTDAEANVATKGRLFKVSGKDGGSTYINGFTANDTIQVTEDGISIYQYAANASFYGQYYLFRIGNHTVYLQGDGAKQGATLPIFDKNGTAWAEAKKVPYLTSGTYENDTVLPYDIAGDTANQVTGVDASLYAAAHASIIADKTFVDVYDGNDYIVSNKKEVTISAGAGNDTIKVISGSDSVSINAAEGNDLIEINAAKATVYAGTGTDTIKNSNASSTVEYQFSTRNGVTYIDGWTADTTIYFPDATTRTRPAGMTVNQNGSEMTLAADNNTIIFKADENTFNNNTTVNVYYGADSIPVGMTENQFYEATAEQRADAVCTIKATARQLAAGDYIEAESLYRVQTAVGIDSKSSGMAVYTGLGEATINVGTDATKVALYASDSYKKEINVTTNVTAAEDGVKVYGGEAADTINNRSDFAYISGGAGENQITNGESSSNKGQKSTLVGGDIKDVITNYAADVVIYGGNGADEITNSGGNVSIFGGDDKGNDSITHSGDGNATIFGGEGNDSMVHGTGTGNVVYYFNSRNGVNTIKNFATNDSLYFAELDARGTFYATANMDLSEVTLSSRRDSNTIVLQGDFKKDNDAHKTELKDNISFKAVRGYAEAENQVVNVSISAVNLTDAADTNYTNFNAGITLNLGAGADVITNEATSVYINGAGTDAKKIINNAAGTATTAVTISTGDGNDTISVGSAAKYAVVNVGEGTNSIISEGANVTVTGGTGVDNVSISGDNGYFSGDNGADIFEIKSGAAGNTITGGLGNDSINNSSADGNVFVYEGYGVREGEDTITGFGDSDTISVNNSRNISATLVDTDGDETNDALRLNLGNYTTVLLKGKATGEVKFLVSGEARTWDIAAGNWKASANVADYNLVSEDVFGDDSDTYTTDNSNSIDSIDYLGTSNYSAGNIENNDLNNLVPKNDATSATFGQDKDNQ